MESKKGTKKKSNQEGEEEDDDDDDDDSDDVGEGAWDNGEIGTSFAL